MDPKNTSKPLRLRPDYGECHGPSEDQPSFCPSIPRGYDKPDQASLLPGDGRKDDDEQQKPESPDSGRTEDSMTKNRFADEDNPCWDGYEMVGMKKDEDGNEVPNCVPKKSAAQTHEDLVRLGTKRPELRPHIRPVLAELERRANNLPSGVHRKFDAIDQAASRVNSSVRDMQRAIARLDGQNRQDAFDILKSQLEGVVEDAKGWIKWVERNS